MNIDIIIPVYNALEELIKCVDSLIKYTDFSINRLILVNDKSSDNKILPYLNKICTENDNFILLDNPENLGFSDSVNKGMKYSKNDVVLLNSDTVATSNWLEKIITCAYSAKEIATVTPYSNNATICSLPNFCEDNIVPDGYSIDSFAQLVEKVSKKKYPKIPVAVGFCMFIKRVAIETVGYFDAETFGKGYGEENDFCYRVVKAGFINVLCDDTYIYHSGSMSFKDNEKIKLMQKNQQILDAKYKELVNDTVLFVTKNPLKYMQDTIKWHTLLDNSKKNILYISHRDFKEGSLDHIGGIQLHIKDLVNNLKNKVNLFVFAQNRFSYDLTLYVNDEVRTLSFPITKDYAIYTFCNKYLNNILGAILDEFRIDITHIHSTYGLSNDIFYLSKERNIPVVFTIHDYFTISPDLKLLNINNEYNEDFITETDIYDELLFKKYKIKNGERYINYWQKEMLNALLIADVIVCPSESAKSIITKKYREIENKIKVVEHGSEIYKIDRQINYKDSNNIFNVAFIGGMCTEKGSLSALELIKKSPKNIKWHVFGIIGDEQLLTFSKKNYKQHGVYKKENLPRLLSENNISLVCILPLLPETYCYTLSEALSVGIPVLGTDIGAVGDRIKNHNVGWTASLNDTSEDILKKIIDISKNNDELFSKKEQVKKYRIKTIEEMSNEYYDLYENLEKKTEHKEPSFNIFEMTTETNIPIKYMKQVQLINKDSLSLKLEIKKTFQLFVYKLKYKIKQHIPFKNFFKKLYYKHKARKIGG